MRTLCFRDVGQSLAHSRLLNAWGAAAISGGSSIINGLLGAYSQKKANEMNLKIARETNENNYKMFQEGNEFNKQMAIDMFNMENEYNDPSAVKERLLRAGFNPAVAMENGAQMVSSGSTSVPSSVGLPSSVVPNIAPVPSIFNGVLTEGIDALVKLAQAKKLGADTRVADKQVVLMDLDAKQKQFNLDLDNKYKEAMMSAQTEEQQAKVKETFERINLLKSQINNLVADGEIKKAQKYQVELQNIFQEENNKWLPKLKGAELNNLFLTGKNIQANTTAAYASADAARASAESSRATARLTDRQRELAGKTIDGVEVDDATLNNWKRLLNQQNINESTRQEIDRILLNVKKGKLSNWDTQLMVNIAAELEYVPVLKDILNFVGKFAK